MRIEEVPTTRSEWIERCVRHMRHIDPAVNSILLEPLVHEMASRLAMRELPPEEAARQFFGYESSLR